MQHGESPDSGADTSAPSEELWQSSRRTACSESIATLSNARTVRNARRHVLCKFQYWIWIGRSSMTRSASFAWRALTRVPLARSRPNSRRITFPHSFIEFENRRCRYPETVNSFYETWSKHKARET